LEGNVGRVVELRSGGQSGADRGAMDAARACGVRVSGWCPRGGWAEDLTEAPGVLALYPELVETPSADVRQRTEWNIRDADCCLVLNTGVRGTSPGTDYGYGLYERYGKPFFEIDLEELKGPGDLEEACARACAWLDGLGRDRIVLGFGGPRASEYPGVYEIAYEVARRILTRLA